MSPGDFAGDAGGVDRQLAYRTIVDPADIDCARHALIEASAGTGKTYTIEHLVLRLVRDEGVPIDRILVVTFTEKATGELKDRIRGKLAADLAGQADIRAQAFQRLQDAVDGFDSAGIYTIHGFCHMVLSRYGFELGRPLRAEVVDDAPLIQSVLRRRMRSLWPRVFEEDLVEMLEFAGFPEYDARRDESRWERRIRRVVLSSASEPKTIPPAPPSAAALRESYRKLREEATRIFGRISEVIGEAHAEDPGESDFTAAFARLNQKAPSRNRKLKNFILPLFEMIGHLSEGRGAPAAALAYLDAARRAGLDSEMGFRTLSEEHWAKAGDNIAEVCPTLPELVAALEDLRALDFHEAQQALAAETIAGVNRELVEHKRADASVSFNDMLELVRAALAGEASALLELLREQFRHAIVDEFQDTDPVQWEIFRRLYLDAGSRGVLYLVGDPKQAIYGFRGADVFAYFQARKHLEALAEKKNSEAALYRLATNYRSLPELVRVFNALFSTPAFFGAPVHEAQDSPELPDAAETISASAIDYTPALEAPAELRKIQVFADESGRRALQLIRLDHAGSGTAAKRKYFRFLAREIHGLVRSQKIRLGASEAAAHPLGFGDVSILLRTRSDAPLIEDALERWNIPHSFYKKTGLYQTKEALELSLVLRAIEAPARLEAGYKAGLTRFFRFSLADVDLLRRRDQSPDDGEEPAFRTQINAWAGLAERRNWPAFFRSILQTSAALAPGDAGVFEPQYERTVTNYEQICDELAEHAVRENLDLTGIIEHLEFLRDETTPVREEWDVHRQESEDARVKLMTIHTAKGLEFPIVCVAGGFTRRMAHLYESFEYHDDEGERVHDLLLSDEERFRREEEAEERRLYYVAFTRAAMKLYVPYYRPADPRGKHTAGALARFVRDAIDAAYAPEKVEDDEAAPAPVCFLDPDAAGDFFEAGDSSGPAGDRGSIAEALATLKDDNPDANAGAAAGRTRSADPKILFPEAPVQVHLRRRDLLSYTALAHAGGHSDAQLADEFQETPADRTDATDAEAATESETIAESGLAFAGPPEAEDPEPAPAVQELDRRMRGADAGTMLHDILERLDYTAVAGDARRVLLSEDNRRLIARLLRRNGLLAAPEASTGDASDEIERAAVDFVGQMMRRVLSSPLRGVGADFRLQDLAPEHRIHEMEFYFHVPELFESPSAGPGKGLSSSLEPDEDSRARGARALRFQDGYVWGFIDLIFRSGGRYYLADWKSNVLNDYSERGLAAAMQERQYDLQYRIYTYALIGWLRNHIPDFNYERDFGGAYYFFLRGMDPGAPGRGVYFARPTEAESAQILEEIRNRVAV
ncbi:MAG: UvrD-helicase domain-containing protein [bacterium]|nr:UvrD-helicase domain-containing protein [bacterium]